jgi:hypothetical protein
METISLEQLRYPVGKFKAPESYTAEIISGYIKTIESFPSELSKAVQGLNDKQLDTPYREGGWTVRQVVHHVVDSHMNAYIRFKLALTEDNPTIKPYNEALWAELQEAKHAPIQLSLPLLEALHKRWVASLKTLAPEDLNRTFYHPDSKANVPLTRNMGIYAWHCNHHLAHITELRKRMGWK